MTITEKPLSELVQALPPDLQAQVRSYVTRLLQEQEGRAATPLRQTWAGALRDLRDQMTAVALQHRATDWMAEGALRRRHNDVSR